MAKQLICTQCHSIGTPKTIARGSFWIEVVLWLLFLVPGLIYSIWRLTTKRKACQYCGASSLVPLSSPMGQKLRQQNQKA